MKIGYDLTELEKV